MKSTEPGTPTIAEWLNSVLKSKAKIGVDPKLVSIGILHVTQKESTISKLVQRIAKK